MKKFFFLLNNNFWKLMRVNLLFVLFSIPIITIPAAAGGIARVTGKLVRDGYCFVWDEFWDEFKKGFGAYLLEAVCCLVIFAIGIGLIYLYSKTQSVLGIALFVIGLLIIALSVICFIYAITINANIDLPPAAVMKDALILSFAYGGRNFLIFACLTALSFISWMFFPYSAVFLLLIVFAIVSLAISMILEDPIYKHIIIPFRNENEHQDLR